MRLDHDACYRALAARDRRFDGVFFVGVTSTGVYCRPVCPARTPGRGRCLFFESAARAEREGFRPCLRCRPELAPGHAPVDGAAMTARAAAALIQNGALDEGGLRSVGALAARLGLSPRQLRRVMTQELGVTPVELAQTRRLLLAKRLLAETRLPMSAVASAAGFGSLRRFNALFLERYGMPPSRLRRGWGGEESGRRGGGGGSGGELVLTLPYRPPLAWAELLAFVRGREMRGVERVDGDVYERTAAVGAARGWLSVRNDPERGVLRATLSEGLAPAVGTVLARLRAMFDLDARPDVIAAHLGTDGGLAPLVAARPGLRVPGAFDGFEVAVRAVLGQQVSVAAATTLAGRVCERFGETIETPRTGLSRLSPTPERLASSSAEELAALGLPRARAETLLALARAFAEGEVALEPGLPPELVLPRLLEIRGIGPWTGAYLAMRALRWPDAFPGTDLVLKRVLAARTEGAAAAEAWRPWRSYAAMHLWAGWAEANRRQSGG